MTVTIETLQGFLAFMVKNNQPGVTSALRSLGYTPASTPKGLIDQLMGIYSTKGTNGLSAVFVRVPIDMSKTSNTELASIQETLTGKKQEVVLEGGAFTWQDFAKLWSGSDVIVGSHEITTEEKKPALGATAVIVIAVVAVVALLLIWKMK